MSDKKLLVSSRKYIRIQVTRLFNTRQSFDNLSVTDKNAKKVQLKSYVDELKTLDSKIQEILWSENDENEDILFKELNDCEGYIEKLNVMLGGLDQTQLSNSNSNIDAARSLLKSPIAPLPIYNSKDTESVDKFLIEFEDTVSKFNYTDRDKLLLLKQQVKGRASYLLESLELSKQTFKDAKDLLREALSSPSLAKFNVLKKLVDLKLNLNDEPFLYISNVSSIVEEFKTLKVEINDVLQYFVWRGLNETFQNQLVNITNKLRPDLDLIQKFFFEASERYSIAKSNLSKSKVNSIKDKENSTSSTSLAVDIGISRGKESKVDCVLCVKDKISCNHPIHKCEKYSTPKDKISKLKEMNYCLKCTRPNHKTEMCKFRLKNKCFNCNQWHFTFLCTESGKPDSSKVKKEVKECKVNSNTAVVESYTCMSEESVLPSFTCFLPTGQSIRGLKDGGCQGTFISEKLAKDSKCLILRDQINLTINGMNYSKKYLTKHVQVELKFGDNTNLVDAYVLPSLNINLDLPNLKYVVDMFTEKGYKLADENLLNMNGQISDFDLLLGTNNFHCILDRSVAFGGPIPSVYLESPCGVMLSGKIDRYISNVNDLPHFSNKEVSKISNTFTSFCKEKLSFKDEFSSSVNVIANVKFAVLDKKGDLIEKELHRAADRALNDVLNYNFENPTPSKFSDLDESLIKHCLDNTIRKEDGRLVMPLLWKNNVQHLLGKNFNLAKAVLNSNFKKLSNKPDLLKLMDNSIKESASLGIIEKVPNIEQFLNENVTCSFLPHMPIFKLNRESTKCRIVFLSNICENEKSKNITFSHNQVMHAGPSLNPKIGTALIHLRFGSHIFCYDICKAFNQIELYPRDQEKLLFFWYNNISKNDLSIVAYKNIRLSFGLRCSPTILMLGLFKILMIDSESDSTKLRNFKVLLYHLLYMDNGAFTCDDSKELMWAYDSIEKIFLPYQIKLQQYVSNNEFLQNKINLERNVETPDNVKLLGLNWSRSQDTLSTFPIDLDSSANTKRLILKSIASHFDLFNFHGPVLNRARLFIHDIQCEKTIKWDDILPDAKLKEWRLIVKQANNSPCVEINRFVGRRDGNYDLITCVDASANICGAVLYIKDVDNDKTSFLLAKSKLINSKNDNRTIPALELQAIAMGSKLLTEVKDELTGDSCTVPIKVNNLLLCSDSLVALSWVSSWTQKLEKMNKHSVFVKNKLNEFEKYCSYFPISFKFISGPGNPGDCITRCLSYKVLKKSNYYDGPNFNHDESNSDTLEFQVPNPKTKNCFNISANLVNEIKTDEHLIPLDRYSSFDKLVKVHAAVLKCLAKWRKKVSYDTSNFYNEALTNIISKDQSIHYSKVKSYFSGDKNIPKKDIPDIVTSLNVYKDRLGLFRVKGKFCEPNKLYENFPILLSKNSKLTELIILELHDKLKHARCYPLLNELRKRFWVPHQFSVIKNIIKECVICKRFKTQNFKLNQSFYRDFRVDPCKVPFSYIYLDHFGPYVVKFSNDKFKVWLLCITCMFTRAVNLKVCLDLTVKEFLNAFQLHVFDFGLPQYVISDLGSQLIKGANVITDFLSDSDTLLFFKSNGVQPIKFDNYFKGNSSLGSLVEVCVRMCKHLIHKSIKNYVLGLKQFEFIISQTIHLINRRPISFKDDLRTLEPNEIPFPITPEMLIHGFDLNSFNVIPNLQADPDLDEEFLNDNVSDQVNTIDDRLRKVRINLINLYHNEFLSKLMYQAVNKKGRYLPVEQKNIKVGDVIMLKEPLTKSMNYPLGIVKKIYKNDLNEVTNVELLKGKTKEIVKRHVTSLIPYLSLNEDFAVSTISQNDLDIDSKDDIVPNHCNRKRNSALESEKRNKWLFQNNLA